MTNFVLVHGSGQNASCWEQVSELLIAGGHRVATPELPKGRPDLRLQDHAMEIARFVTEPRTVVVGHSLCGAFLPLITEHTECGLLVFLAAVVPEVGKSLRDQFTEDAGMFSADWISAGQRWKDESQVEGLAREFLFHDCDEPTVQRCLPTLEAIDTSGLVVEASPMGSWPSVPRASIVASRDRTLKPDWCRSISRRVLGVEPQDIDAGHCPQNSRPVDLARRLQSLALDEGL